MPEITLVPVSEENEHAVIELSVKEAQRHNVADNARSLSQGREDEGAWIRVIMADGEPVGFIMMHDETLRAEPEQPGYIYLWRMMIDQRYQGLGYGAAAMKAAADYARSRPGATEIMASFVDNEQSAGGFYERLGFEKTGNMVGGEVEIRLIL